MVPAVTIIDVFAVNGVGDPMISAVTSVNIYFAGQCHNDAPQFII